MPSNLQLLVDSIDGIVQVSDLEGNIKLVNSSWRQIVGYGSHDPDSLTISDVMPPSDEGELRALIKRIAIHERAEQFQFNLRTNTSSSIKVSGKIIVFPAIEGGKLLIGIFKSGENTNCDEPYKSNGYQSDTTGLAISPSDLTHLSEIAFNHIPIGLCWRDTKGRVVHCNNRLASWLDSKPDQITSLNSFFSGGRTPWPPPTNEEISSRDQAREKKIETNMQSAKGRNFPTSILVRPLHFQDVTYQLIVIRDLTAEDVNDERVLKAQRLESVGVLAGGIAHDLNNTLLPISLGLDLLRNHADSKQIKLIDGMQASAQRASGLVKQMLMFAKRTELRLRPIAPQQLLQELTKIVTNTFPPNIHVDISSDCADIHLIGDDVHLLRVLINLALNARDAMPTGGMLRIRALAIEVDKIYAESIADGYPGKFIRFEVVDAGGGIAPEIIDRIYDPFFTTKGPDKGTGLGLSAVLGIVKGHRGFLKLYSTVGHGTRFSIYIPQAVNDQLDTSTTIEPTLSRIDGSGLCALVVDDETFVREVLVQALEDLGFQVSAFEDGAKALNFASRSKTPIGLLITDLHMPHINGITLVQAIRRRNGSIPVIVMSGRLTDEDRKNLLQIGAKEFLAKPFNKIDLLGALNAAIPNGARIAP